MVVSTASGFILGYAAAVFFYTLTDFAFSVNIPLLILGNVLIAAVYSLAYVAGIRKYYLPCCSDTLSLREED